MRGVLRLSGMAAVAGGVLRIVDSFTTQVLSAGTLTMLYFVTDIFLLAGIAGLWLRQRSTLGIAGTLGIAVFVAGILMIRASAFGIGAYQLGAAVALLGLALYSLETLFKRSAAILAPVLWLTSLAAGVAGMAGFAPQAMTIAAGVTFGTGFIVAGAEMLRAQSSLAVR